MGRKRKTTIENKPNPKRAEAKKKRGFGSLVMDNTDPIVWAQKHDPLFKIKGIERHRKMKEIR